MKAHGQHTRTIWVHPENPEIVQIIDQCALPHFWKIDDLLSCEDAAVAIRTMKVRGAGLIGATAGFGMYLAALEMRAQGLPRAFWVEAGARLKTTRPTAVNLAWAVDRQIAAADHIHDPDQLVDTALKTACAIADEDAGACRRIGLHGLEILSKLSESKGGATVNVLTHCNAGWLAFVDYGSATAPIYAAYDAGIPIHVWVDETRPRNQGAKLTAWELGQHGVPHTLIADNAGGHLMQHGMVDAVIVGTDRTTRTGDVANKIGTYLKALAAKDNSIPFYVALPSSSFDWDMRDGLAEIPIEQRGADELLTMDGLCDGKHCTVRIAPASTPAANYGFDVTPSRLVTALITEYGVCDANEASIAGLHPMAAACHQGGSPTS